MTTGGMESWDATGSTGDEGAMSGCLVAAGRPLNVSNGVEVRTASSGAVSGVGGLRSAFLGVVLLVVWFCG